jgi:hypothetical protein
MNGKELFGVVVRKGGFIIALYGIWCIAFGVLSPIVPANWLGSEHEGIAFLFSGTTSLFVGVALLRWSDIIVRMSYPTGTSVAAVNPPGPTPDAPAEPD